MKRMMIGALSLWMVACGGVGAIQTDVDKVDRPAFTALKAFQDGEETEWHAKAVWPTPAQHQQIGAKLSQAYVLLSDTAAAALALQPGQSLSAVVTAELAQLGTLVTDIVALASTAPPAVTARVETMRHRVDQFREKVGRK